jgi:pyruvate oxidase
MMSQSKKQLDWYRVAASDELPEGRVKTVVAGTQSMALTHIDGEFSAMANRCPHQGGPLGEGSIEVGNDGQCWLRCPWHGWDFDPKTYLVKLWSHLLDSGREQMLSTTTKGV